MKLILNGFLLLIFCVAVCVVMLSVRIQKNEDRIEKIRSALVREQIEVEP